MLFAVCNVIVPGMYADKFVLQINRGSAGKLTHLGSLQAPLSAFLFLFSPGDVVIDSGYRFNHCPQCHEDIDGSTCPSHYLA